MSKVASSLLSGRYSSVPAEADEGSDKSEKNAEKNGDDVVVVAPRMFKHLVGQGHAEFSSGRQQDAAEYMQHLLEVKWQRHEARFCHSCLESSVGEV